uniref:Putative translation initiation inhibitor n=1 Tax=Xenopsylla cheopis TaxID=163159 RepID=A0A6M2DGE7_XENCH
MTTIIRKIVSTKAAARPVAPYNQAVLVDRTLYVSGCLGLDKNTMKLVPGGAAAEARQALTNLGHILMAGDSSYDRVVKTTVLLADLADFQAVNEVYAQVFTHDHPARSSFQVGALPLNARVEIEVVAVSGDVRTIPVTE